MPTDPFTPKELWERNVHYQLLKRTPEGKVDVRGRFAYRARVFERYWRMFGDQLIP